MVKEVLGPLVVDGRVWEDVDTYLRARYYLASAYGSLGQQEQLEAVVQRLASASFKPERMEANQCDFHLICGNNGAAAVDSWETVWGTAKGKRRLCAVRALRGEKAGKTWHPRG